jgi:hypothetical protein
VHALGLRQHPGIGLELAVGRERHPEGFHLVALQRGGGGHGGVPDVWFDGQMIRKIDTWLKWT